MWFKKYFDWIVVYADDAVWGGLNDDGGEWKERCFYIIEYSKSRNKFRLKAEGYKAKKHRMYRVMLQQLSSFNVKTILK